MIDVVFLLLVFFMLAASFDDLTEIPLRGAGASINSSDSPRLVEVLPDSVRLNGNAISDGLLPDALTGLPGGDDDLIVLRGLEGASVQRLLDVVSEMSSAGFSNLALVE
jgi:biopolymer transport protein ExbD